MRIDSTVRDYRGRRLLVSGLFGVLLLVDAGTRLLRRGALPHSSRRFLDVSTGCGGPLVGRGRLVGARRRRRLILLLEDDLARTKEKATLEQRLEEVLGVVRVGEARRFSARAVLLRLDQQVDSLLTYKYS